MTQEEKILKYLEDFQTITAYQAVVDLGITQLSARLCGLQKRGYEFDKEMCFGTNRYGEKTHYIKYSLKGQNNG